MSRIVSKSDLIPGLIDDVDIFRIKPSRVPLRSQLTNIEQLAQSIKERGLLQPIVVRADNNGSFEIVAGNRRFNACKSLGWRKVPSHIVELDDREAFEISLIENLQRKTLNPIEEAEAFKKYVSDFGWGGVSDLARKIGKNKSYVTRRIKLLVLPKEVLDAIEQSAVSKSVAQELCSVIDKSQQSELGELVKIRHLTMRNTRTLVSSNNAESNGEMSQSINVSSMEERYQRAFDRAILLLKSSITKLSTTVDGVEENWIVRDALMHHKGILHSEIDVLVKQKKKLQLRAYHMC